MNGFIDFQPENKKNNVDNWENVWTNSEETICGPIFSSLTPSWLRGNTDERQSKYLEMVTHVTSAMGFTPIKGLSHVYTWSIIAFFLLSQNLTWPVVWRTTCHIVLIYYCCCIMWRLGRLTFVGMSHTIRKAYKHEPFCVAEFREFYTLLHY